VSISDIPHSIANWTN